MAGNQDHPPALPDAQQLQFDFTFFDQGESLGAGWPRSSAGALSGSEKAAGHHDHFFNAYLRAVVLDAMAHMVLAAPVTAFAAAVHTVPEAQADGAWLWTYTWQSGSGPVDILLRGLPTGQVVRWELSLVHGAADQAVLWFSGWSRGAGDQGHFDFQDLDDPQHPLCGEINWGLVDGGTYLEFISHQPDEDGDTLRFTDANPEFSIDFTPGDGSDPSGSAGWPPAAAACGCPTTTMASRPAGGIDLRNADCP